ncbi:hydrolase, alpha/beta fold family [Pseudomassariella vexata]|uniref:alcohol O-acetyltransferase n=1 Tax=Pseudomassariella vexata TaxID=1141098 RepID=A0A1Y2EJG5_9PEZI|nr:hydrolase, alpha/beta fold family [Pseudomassariella vexata]ORY71617.1 hydrolase, alpha/beta fold family [Pseudomassariella vexata]
MDWLGRAKLDFHASATPITVKEKDGSSKSFVDVCKETVPTCQLNPLLFNGHLQTCWTAAIKHAPPVHYRRKLFEADHSGYAGSFAVDFFAKDPSEEEDDSLPPRTVYFSKDELLKIGSDDSRPMLVVLHGLSGGSHEVYLRYAIAPLLESGAWEACVVNSRGCAKSKITSGLLYNARATWDVRQTVKWLRETFPNRPLFGIGFSLGACILTNYLGEEGSGCQLKAALACANPWNLETSNNALNRTFIGHHVYSKVLGTAMKKLAETNKTEIKKYTDFDLEKISKLTYLYEFDREVQCAAWGYPTENAYYRDASSVDSVMAIRIPYMAINSTDDPISSYEALPVQEVKQNPYTVLCTTSLGGHLGWFEPGGGRWHSRPVTNFMNYMAFEADLEPLQSKSNGGTKTYHGGAMFDPSKRTQIPHPFWFVPRAKVAERNFL